MARDGIDDKKTREAIRELVLEAGGNPSSAEGRLIGEMIQTSLKCIQDEHDTGQLKLLARSLKEMRYAYLVFNRYVGTRKIAIFGSARTQEEHADYGAAKQFSRAMAGHAWMVITGAGDGIMKAGHEGPQREASFGLSIRLPFETTANEVIEGDPKLINFKYFFARKLMFMTHADAVAVFPGGFGTQDELFEALTLVQTGKSNMVPIVLLEGEGGTYWSHWERYVQQELLGGGFISPEDGNLFYIAESVEDAVQHVCRFYRRYQSSRYHHEELVIRMNTSLAADEVDALNEEFGDLVKSGRIEQRASLDEENVVQPEIPCLVLKHTRYHYGRVRAMIDRINDFVGAPTETVG
jgi:hypothetical protein